MRRNYDYFPTTQISFTLYVPEQQIVDRLVQLQLSEIVYRAIPNLIIKTEGVEEISSGNDIPPISTSPNNTNASSYDPETTAWAFDMIHYSNALQMDNEVLVGVLDTGYTPHEDVECVDMNLARNFYDRNNLYDVTDYDGHGTFIVGEIGATMNGKGVNGVCSYATIVPIRIARVKLNDEGEIESAIVNYQDVIDALNYSESIGIKVVNISYFLNENLAISIADSNYTGVVVISAGNDNSDVENIYDYGYKYIKPNWLIVGAVQNDGKKHWQSNYSKKYVHLFAPSQSIRGIAADGTGYTNEGATSMAAPFVTGAAAILLEDNPFLTSEQICQKLMNTVTKDSQFTNYCVSGGILNISAATTSLRTDYRGAYSLGDIDGDGYITETDYILLKRAVLGTFLLNSQQSLAADVNNDQTVDTIDYMLVKRFILGTLYFPPHHI